MCGEVSAANFANAHEIDNDSRVFVFIRGSDRYQPRALRLLMRVIRRTNQRA
jgi:hypothetical protein